MTYEVNICDKCNTPTEMKIEILDKWRVVPIMCKCKKIQFEEDKRVEENTAKQDRLKQIITNSLMDEGFKEKTFYNWNHDLGNEKMYRVAKKYSSKFAELKKESIGLFIVGEAGNGKTFTTCCIANELLDNYIPVICVSIDSLLKRIQQTFNSWGKEGQSTILNSLTSAELIIIDDLGTEQDSEWNQTTVYNIIDEIYRSKTPLIISTNVSLQDVKEKYHPRVYSRITEMCTVVKNDGKSIRAEKGKEKSKILNELFK